MLQISNFQIHMDIRSGVGVALQFIINIKSVKVIDSLGNKPVLYLICNRIKSFVGVLNGKAEQPA